MVCFLIDLACVLWDGVLSLCIRFVRSGCVELDKAKVMIHLASLGDSLIFFFFTVFFIRPLSKATISRIPFIWREKKIVFEMIFFFWVVNLNKILRCVRRACVVHISRVFLVSGEWV